MRTKRFFFATAVFAIVGSLNAGTLELQPKESAPPTITESEPWQFTIAVPGWMASMNGTIGIRGVNADLDVGFFDDILEHLDMIFTLRAEAQKGPFGIFGEVIYLGLSDDAQINGMINNIHEQVDLTLVDGALSWRLVNQPRWSLDLAAGFHYNNVFQRLELHSDPNLIQQTSERFVNTIAGILRARLDQDISNSEFLETLRNTVKADIVSRIGDALERVQNRPNIPIGPLGGHIRQEIAQRIENFIEKERAALEAQIDALHLRGEARRAAVARAVDAAKARLANQIALRLDRSLSQTLSKDDYWFAGYGGLKFRYNFNKTFYTAVRGEIGRGVANDLMWEAEGVLGINITRSVFTEIGYRALGSDFQDNNFRFDVVTHGPQITTGVTF